MKDKIINRPTSWYVINIKARRNQVPSHYINAWKNIKEQDPLVDIPRTANRVVSVKNMIFGDENGVITWISTRLVAYTIIDPDQFYNRRTKEKLHMEWDDNIAANMKESELFFIPAVHKVAVRKSSEISINYILYYLQEAFNKIEQEGFDIDIVKDHDSLEKILSAHSIYTIEADISYSNPGNTRGFQRLFEDKARGANPNQINIKLVGSKNNPLQVEEDGLVKALINLSEENGSVKAVISQTENSAIEIIDTNQHPFILRIPQIINDYCSTVYREFMTRYNQNE